jgi:hypothetical protein
MELNLPLLAGAVSTAMFTLSTLPMLRKAYRTRDLSSYSPGNILLSNAGNVIHAVYVFHLPPGPIWLLHTFHLVTTGLMLLWYLRFEAWAGTAGTRRARGRLLAQLTRASFRLRVATSEP